MEKEQAKKSKQAARKRLIAYGIVIGGFSVVSLATFFTSLYYKAQASAAKAIKDNAEIQLNLLEKKTKNAAVVDEIAWYQDEKDVFTYVYEKNNNGYKWTSTPAYVLSTLTLIAFGTCLIIEDKAKEKEEKD